MTYSINTIMKVIVTLFIISQKIRETVIIDITYLSIILEMMERLFKKIKKRSISLSWLINVNN